MQRRKLWVRSGFPLSRFRQAPTPKWVPPISSFPFLSGDTFLQLAAFVFDDKEVIRRRGLTESICFAPAPVAARPDFLKRARDLRLSAGGELKTLIIHNGDHIPSTGALERLGEIFETVYSVNVTRESPHVQAIPIGLENARLANHGKLSPYLDAIEGPSPGQRQNLVLSSFHVSTNPQLRGGVASLFEKSRFGFDGHTWKRGEYQERLRKSCFVISPPGNGADCHRTWEAIYMGAVPVVLKDHIAPSLVKDMPILAVKNYEEFLQKPDELLWEQYCRLIAVVPTKAFAPHWIARCV